MEMKLDSTFGPRQQILVFVVYPFFIGDQFIHSSLLTDQSQ